MVQNVQMCGRSSARFLNVTRNFLRSNIREKLDGNLRKGREREKKTGDPQVVIARENVVLRD